MSTLKLGVLPRQLSMQIFLVQSRLMRTRLHLLRLCWMCAAKDARRNLATVALVCWMMSPWKWQCRPRHQAVLALGLAPTVVHASMFARTLVSESVTRSSHHAVSPPMVRSFCVGQQTAMFRSLHRFPKTKLKGVLLAVAFCCCVVVVPFSS